MPRVRFLLGAEVEAEMRAPRAVLSPLIDNASALPLAVLSHVIDNASAVLAGAGDVLLTIKQ